MRFLLAVFICLPVSLAAQVLVLPGDHPDPSVTKAGDSYWASATTSNWAPAYPLLESKDLVTWQLRGYAFNPLPAWADYYFWAPEISYEKGRTYLYYTAHKRDGNLCVAVASADRPEGPYQDHGPLLCQEVGSIDAFPMRDEHGKLFLIWKEDANSVKLPTPIWAMEMNEERTKLQGEKKELFRNELPWESNVAEGVSMIYHEGYYYAFYAGAGCCGRGCNYGIGIARSKKLLGPWEKYPGNPILQTTPQWKCPGHGTPVEKDGRFYFLYHAYSVSGDVYVGRQGILSEFKFTSDHWIQFLELESSMNVVPAKLEEEFNGNVLSEYWQWSVFQKHRATIDKGMLTLNALPEKSGAFLGQGVYTSNYVAETTVVAEQSDAESGLSLLGDEKNLVAVSYQHGKLRLWKLEADKETLIKEENISSPKRIYLRLTVRNGNEITFSYSMDNKKFLTINTQPVDGFFLPPWDRGVRISLLAKGEAGQRSVFDRFEIRNE